MVKEAEDYGKSLSSEAIVYALNPLVQQWKDRIVYQNALAIQNLGDLTKGKAQRDFFMKESFGFNAVFKAFVASANPETPIDAGLMVLIDKHGEEISARLTIVCLPKYKTFIMIFTRE